MVSLRESLDSANRLLNDRLSEGTATLDKRMAVIGEIENKLGKLSTQTDNIENIGKNIQSLSELLKPPKLRGNLGELFLENLLNQILPSSLYQMQYQFKDGQRVDAIVKLGSRILPIDSKFPIESYKDIEDSNKENYKSIKARLKKYIDDISGKYIRPGENTTDIALMYIPAEAVYTAFIASEDTSFFEYALSKKVIPSSPGHLYGFLASISEMYFETALTNNSKNLSVTINELTESLQKLNGFNERIGGSLRSAVTSNEKTRSELQKMQSQLDKLKEPDNFEKIL